MSESDDEEEDDDEPAEKKAKQSGGKIPVTMAMIKEWTQRFKVLSFVYIMLHLC
jgi:hypothetical protein